MSKGRNSAVVTVRLSDAVVERIKALACKRRVTISELLKPVIENIVDGEVEKVKEIKELSIETRNKAREKRKKKKKKKK